MKDHVEIDHLTKYDVFRVNRDQVMDLQIWLKTHTNVSNFETASPKTLKIFYQFCDNCKIPSCTYYLKELRWKSLCLPILKSITEIMKNFKSLYGSGGPCLKIRDVVRVLSLGFSIKVSRPFQTPTEKPWERDSPLLFFIYLIFYSLCD